MILLHPVKKVFFPHLYAVIKNQHSKYRILVISYETYLPTHSNCQQGSQPLITPQISVSPLANTMINFLTSTNPKSPLLGINSKRNGNNLYILYTPRFSLRMYIHEKMK